MRDLSARWSMLLNESRAAIPDPPFLSEAGDAVVELKSAG